MCVVSQSNIFNLCITAYMVDVETQLAECYLCISYTL
jgi:hypothetical protein